jgi:type I restriction enzyme, S subunit
MTLKRQWTTQPVGELRAKTKYALTGGPFGSNLVSRDYTNDGVPVIRGCNLPDNVPFAFDDLVFVSEKKADALRPNNAFPGDLVFTQRGTLGQVGLIPRNSPYPRFVISQSQMKLTVAPDKADQRYLYYYFRLPSTVEAIQSLAISSGVPHINLDILRKFQVITSPVQIQRKIAAIVSSYDELIENNKRRIALLEKMAEEIYREWFVRLRFPGHEKVKIVKGVPEAWEVLRFSEIVKINPSERVDKSEEKPFVGMEDLSLTSMFFSSKEMRKGSAGSKFRNRDILFPRITPSVENGKRGFVMTLADQQVGLGSTEFIVLREKEIGPEHIYFLTCSSDFRKHAELSMVGASGRQRVHENCFSFFLVKTPPLEVRQKFSEVMEPLFSQIHLLSRQTDQLVKSRDLLLPRLISGKLSVENLDIQFPPGMAEETEVASC